MNSEVILGHVKKQRAVGEHLLHDKENKLHSILSLIKLKYMNTFTMGFVTNSFEECEYYSRKDGQEVPRI